MFLNLWMWIAWFVYWLIAGAFVNRTRLAEGNISRLQHQLLLSCGLFLILHNRHRPFIPGRLYTSEIVEYSGNMLTVAGLLFSIWARVHLGRYWSGIITLKEGHKLIRTGPYQLVRHPIYTGLIGAAAGSAITASSVDSIIGWILFLLACSIKIYREEALLISEFGDDYRQFKKEVPALLPLGLIKSTTERNSP